MYVTGSKTSEEEFTYKKYLTYCVQCIIPSNMTINDMPRMDSEILWDILKSQIESQVQPALPDLSLVKAVSQVKPVGVK